MSHDLDALCGGVILFLWYVLAGYAVRKALVLPDWVDGPVTRFYVWLFSPVLAAGAVLCYVLQSPFVMLAVPGRWIGSALLPPGATPVTTDYLKSLIGSVNAAPFRGNPARSLVVVGFTTGDGFAGTPQRLHVSRVRLDNVTARRLAARLPEAEFPAPDKSVEYYMSGVPLFRAEPNRPVARTPGAGIGIDEARELAARCWCEPTTSGRVMDVALAEVFAQLLVRVTAPSHVPLTYQGPGRDPAGRDQ